MWEGIRRHSVVCVCRGSSKAVALELDGRSQRERHCSEGRHVKIVIPRISAFGNDSVLQKACLCIYRELLDLNSEI